MYLVNVTKKKYPLYESWSVSGMYMHVYHKRNYFILNTHSVIGLGICYQCTTSENKIAKFTFNVALWDYDIKHTNQQAVLLKYIFLMHASVRAVKNLD